ncbi:potassium uptake protein KtrB [Williamsoniiplasma somnilux]|uniref:Potassium uptake protein KtrB n=1 Tax=Williamsoniiplasma somnilux TaxID=215578 RepID=A0A2K8P1V7_9MOLU|nr:potassium transporter TrkG [Williamsoniiplasma somnilux]ATZ18991.1 potassium uptake protein KtrB [Williamsoniiplasma somnilux]
MSKNEMKSNPLSNQSPNSDHTYTPDHDENKNRKFNEKLFLKMKKLWPLSKISGRIFLIYLLVVLLGGLLLSIPGVVVNDNFHWSFLTGIFTASSAFSDTGINIADVSHDYSFWGQLLCAIMIEIGGIGILTFKIVLFLAINKRISLNDTQTAQSERGSSTTAYTIELIRDGFIWLTIVQISAAIVLFFAFFFQEPGTITQNMVDIGGGQYENTALNTVSPFHDFKLSLWFAIFHSTSAINNAGFDIISSGSLQPYNVQGHYSYLIQVVFLMEWILGGLGYPTFHDIKRKIRARRAGYSVKFSLFAKLNFWVYSFFLIAGPLMVFGTEMINQDQSMIFNYYQYETGAFGVTSNVEILSAKPMGVAIMDIIFNTTACRNAGFSTVPINDFNAGSKTIMSALMFIGSAPSSTAGGIRTTTFAIIMLATWAIIRNNRQTTAFKKTIPEITVKRAFAVFFISATLVIISIIAIYSDSAKVLSPTQTGDTSVVQILTLITSAFGTVGMNPFTGEQMVAFGALSKIVMIMMMFLGQLGISNTLLVFVKPSTKKMYGYLEEDVVIG